MHLPKPCTEILSNSTSTNCPDLCIQQPANKRPLTHPSQRLGSKNNLVLLLRTGLSTARSACVLSTLALEAGPRWPAFAGWQSSWGGWPRGGAEHGWRPEQWSGLWGTDNTFRQNLQGQWPLWVSCFSEGFRDSISTILDQQVFWLRFQAGPIRLSSGRLGNAEASLSTETHTISGTRI